MLALAASEEDARNLHDVDLKIKVEVSNLPLPVIREGAAAVGAVNVRHDPDGAIRRVPVRVHVGGESELAFDAQLYRQVTAAGFPTKALPTSDEILINFRGYPNSTFASVPYYRVVKDPYSRVEKTPRADVAAADVLRGGGPPEMLSEEFRGKIVLIGPTTEVLKDAFSTPFARACQVPIK